MSLAPRAGRNISLKFLGEALSRALAVVFVFYAARKLGAEDFGRYSFAVSFAFLFVILTDLGLNTLLIRDVSRERALAERYMGNVLAMKLILSLAAFLLIAAAINLTAYPPLMVRVVCLTGLALVFSALTDYMAAIFNAFERMELEALVKTANRLFMVVLGGGVLFMGRGLELFAAAVAAAHGAALILAARLASRRFGALRPRMERRFWRELLRSALPLALSSVFMVVYYRIDVVMLSLMGGGDGELGLYSAAYKLVDTASLVPFLVVGGLFPIFSSLFRTSPERLASIFETTVKYLLVAALPIAVGTTILAPRFMELIYGAEYAGGADLLRILIWNIPLVFVNYPMLNLLVAVERQRNNVISTGLCVVVNISLNALLIPAHGAAGAAAATVATDAALLAMNCLFVRKYFGKIPLAALSYRPVAAAALMGVAVVRLDGAVALPVTVAAAAALYTALAAVFGVVSAGEIRGLKSALGRGPRGGGGPAPGGGDSGPL